MYRLEQLFRVSQSMTFCQDTLSGIFAKGEKVSFNGYLQCHGREYKGYMRQENEKGNGVLLYVRGLRQESGDLLLLGTTNKNRPIPDCAPICFCSFFYDFKNEGEGYLDDTEGIPTTHNSYFFNNGEYIAKPFMVMDEINLSKNYDKRHESIKKKLNRKIEPTRGKKDVLFLERVFNGLSLGIMDRYPV